MSDKEKKRTYDIKEEVLNILLSIDNESVEGRVINAARKKYFERLDSINQWKGELNRKLNMIDSDTDQVKSLHGKLAVNEKGIAALKDEILILKKKNISIENPDQVLEEFDRQEVRLSELADQESELGKEIFEIEKNLRKDFNEATVTAAELKEINVEIEKKNTQKRGLAADVKKLEKSAKVFITRARLKDDLNELENKYNALSEELRDSEDTISECGESIPELRDAILSLQAKIDPLEKMADEVIGLVNERETIRTELEGLEPEHAEMLANVAELNITVAEKQKMLDDLTMGNSDMKHSITSIEKAIETFGETVNEINVAKERLKDSTSLNEHDITELEGQFRDKLGISNNLFLMEETMQTIIESVKARI